MFFLANESTFMPNFIGIGAVVQSWKRDRQTDTIYKIISNVEFHSHRKVYKIANGLSLGHRLETIRIAGSFSRTLYRTLTLRRVSRIVWGWQPDKSLRDRQKVDRNVNTCIM